MSELKCVTEVAVLELRLSWGLQGVLSTGPG